MHSHITLLLSALALAILSPVSAYDPLNNAIKAFCSSDSNLFVFQDDPEVDKNVNIFPKGAPVGTLSITESVEPACKTRLEHFHEVYPITCEGSKITTDQFKESKTNMDAAAAFLEPESIVVKYSGGFRFVSGNPYVVQEKFQGNYDDVKEFRSTFLCKGGSRQITVVLKRE